MLNLQDIITNTLLNERTYPSELYHATSIFNLLRMVEDDSIRLSFASFPDDGWNGKLNEGKFFFLSMTYDRYGRYSHHNRLKVSGGGAHDVVLVMDTGALQSDGKLIDVDYWEHEKYVDNEKEVRFISNNRTITPISKFVNEVHVYIDIDRLSNTPSYSYTTSKLLDDYEALGISVYFYDDMKPLRMQLKAKAVDIDYIRDNIGTFDKDEDGPYRREGRDYLKPILELLDDNIHEYSKDADHLIGLATYYSPNDFIGSVSADLSNASRTSNNSLESITKLFKSKGITNLEDFRKYVANLKIS